MRHVGAVGVVALDDEDRIVLVYQYRHPVGMHLWELPAGLIDVPGEPLEHAAARELAEEVDLVAGSWQLITDIHTSPGCSNEMIRLFLARDLTPVPDRERHHREHEEAELTAHRVPLDEAVAMVLRGEISNAAAVVGVLAAARLRDQGWPATRPLDTPRPMAQDRPVVRRRRSEQRAFCWYVGSSWWTRGRTDTLRPNIRRFMTLRTAARVRRHCPSVPTIGTDPTAAPPPPIVAVNTSPIDWYAPTASMPWDQPSSARTTTSTAPAQRPTPTTPASTDPVATRRPDRQPQRWGSNAAAPTGWVPPNAAAPGVPGTWAPAPTYRPAPPTARPNRGGVDKKKAAGGAAAGAGLLAKFLIAGKTLGLFLLHFKTVASMLVSVAVYAVFWGWWFAAGFVLLMLIHEMGHVFVLRKQGVKATAPMFIPFLGAFVAIKGVQRSVAQEAWSALAGPGFGAAAAAFTLLLADSYHSPLLKALAYTAFLINLFNLIPMLPFDGGRVAGAVNPVLWFGGLAVAAAYLIYLRSVVIVVVLIIGVPELIRRWRAHRAGTDSAYMSIPAEVRWRIGGAYVAVALACMIGMAVSFTPRHF